MLLKRHGYPEEGDIVFCTVTNVQYNSVFVRIEEYNKQGLIHISEISPGRIRNIRDYVKEGKMVVCKVLRIDERKGHIDLSLRRVNERERRQKTDERKQEQKAEKIVEGLAGQLKKPFEKVYEEVSSALMPKYGFLHVAFEEVVESDESLEKMGLKKEYAEPLEALVREKIKPKQVTLSGVITIKTYAESGVDIVRDALVKARSTNKTINIYYLGAGNYSISVEAKDYKDAEKHLKEAVGIAEKTVVSDKTSVFKFKKRERD